MNPCRRGCRSVEGACARPPSGPLSRAAPRRRSSTGSISHVDVGPVAPQFGPLGGRRVAGVGGGPAAGDHWRANASAQGRARWARVNARLTPRHSSLRHCPLAPTGRELRCRRRRVCVLGARSRPRAQGRPDDRRPGGGGDDRGRAPGEALAHRSLDRRDPLSLARSTLLAERRLPRGRGTRAGWRARRRARRGRWRSGRAPRGSRNASVAAAAPGRRRVHAITRRLRRRPGAPARRSEPRSRCFHDAWPAFHAHFPSSRAQALAGPGVAAMDSGIVEIDDDQDDPGTLALRAGPLAALDTLSLDLPPRR